MEVLRSFLIFLIIATITSCGINSGSDGDNGSDGKDAIVKEITCQYDWMLDGAPAERSYDLLYTVMMTTSGGSIATLKVIYRIGEDQADESSETALWSKASGGAASSLVENYLWKVSLVSEKEAKIFRKVSKEEKVISCK